MIENFRINSPRQKRAIIALLEKDSIEVKDLGALIGALNPRQVIFELRQQGFGQIIKTHLFGKIDRDGKHCHPGRYCIAPELKPIVLEFIKRDGLAAVPQKTKLRDVNLSSKNHDKEEV